MISNEPRAAGLEIARQHGVDTEVVDHRSFADRAAFDRALGDAIARYDPHLVVLAGFMRILDRGVRGTLRRPADQYPSVAAAGVSRRAHASPRARGGREDPWLHRAFRHAAGSTTARSSSRRRFRCCADDTEQTLAARVLEQEHRMLPQAVRWFLDGRLHVEGNHVRSPALCRYPDSDHFSGAHMKRFICSSAAAGDAGRRRARAPTSPSRHASRSSTASPSLDDRSARALDVFEHDGKTYSVVSESKTVGLAAMLYRFNIRREAKGNVTADGLRPRTLRRIAQRQVQAQRQLRLGRRPGRADRRRQEADGPASAEYLGRDQLRVELRVLAARTARSFKVYRDRRPSRDRVQLRDRRPREARNTVSATSRPCT